MEIGDVYEKKSLLGKVFYEFENTKFGSREEAESAKESKILLLKENAEQARINSKIEEELNKKRERYNSNPEYCSIRIECQYIQKEKGTWFSGIERSSIVDLDLVNSKIDEACREIHVKGYEVISIMPITSGIGALKRYSKGGGGGWGYSFTNGAIIIGKKR